MLLDMSYIVFLGPMSKNGDVTAKVFKLVLQ